MSRSARVVLCNLHATSVPALVVPWLLAQCVARRVDAVLLQEATPRHRRWLRNVPGWALVDHGAEAILIRARLQGPWHVVRSLTRRWKGAHTGDLHEPRTIPGVLLDGWLYLVSVHFPPNWTNGPDDRRMAGWEYRRALGVLARDLGEVGALFLGGDWNALTQDPTLKRWRARRGLRAHGLGIDHVAHSGVEVVARRMIGRGPGMDHGAWLFVVKEAA